MKLNLKFHSQQVVAGHVDKELALQYEGCGFESQSGNEFFILLFSNQRIQMKLRMTFFCGTRCIERKIIFKNMAAL